jgi:phage shock protein PspC (stress-responsive transcriptional regulator)
MAAIRRNALTPERKASRLFGVEDRRKQIMSMGQELEKLGELHRSGVLSDDEFARAKARVLDGTGMSASRGNEAPAVQAINSLRRSRYERWLGGVCGGIANITGLAAWVWRLLFALLALFAGTGLVLYILLWILLPEEAMPPQGGEAGNLQRG